MFVSPVNASTTDFEKLSASLFAPAHHATPIPVQLAHLFPVQNLDPALADGENDDIDSDDSVETEREWIDEAQLTELTQRFPSCVSEAMAIEVCRRFFF